jgi:hypothetical protein
MPGEIEFQGVASGRMERAGSRVDRLAEGIWRRAPRKCQPVQRQTSRQLFDPIDPSPFRGRDLDPKAEAFIVGWAKDLPLTLKPGAPVFGILQATSPRSYCPGGENIGE